MRVLEKIRLLDRIGRELQSRMTYSEIDVYLGAYDIDCKDFQPSANSKWVYVKELLADADEHLLLTIADELDIEHNHSIASPKEATFWKAGHFKLFLSHLASFKANTARLQQALKYYAVTSFVAHEDIEPSKEWQIEIEAALHTMDAMVVLLMPGFKESNWCDQEVGVAVGRDVLIVPVKKGVDPYGFIGKYQAIQAANKNIGEVAEAIYETILNSPKTRTKLLWAISNSVSQSTDVSDAIEKVRLLREISDLPEDILESMKMTISENNVLVKSKLFIAELNKLLSSFGIDGLSIGGAIETLEWDDEIPF